MIQPFASIIILVALTALITSLKSMFELYQLGKLKKYYWKHQGLKTFSLTLIWFSLLFGGIGLFLDQSWGKPLTNFGLWALLLLMLITGLFRILGLGLLGAAFSSKEIIDPNLNKAILGSLIGLLFILMILGAAIYFLHTLP